MFLQGRGLNSSYAIFQDATGKAMERTVALGIGVGSGYLFETTFEKEVYSDLTGERGSLMGGMDWMYANCSTTAQRGALDWMGPFHDAIKPVMRDLYASVKSGEEAQRSIDSNSKPDYREGLEKELAALRESEMWQAGAVVRKLRPENN